MRVIRLDGGEWKTSLDFLEALLDAIEQGRPHGLSLDAFVDSMVYGGMGGAEPPYTIEIFNVADAPPTVVEEIIALSSAIEEARMTRRSREGVDIDVTVSCPELAI